MCVNGESLSAAKIKYLIAIYELDQGYGVRSADIARKLGVTNPSVHSMVKIFEDMGIVCKEYYGVVRLTEEGRALAVCYGKKFLSLSGLLETVLPDSVQFYDAVSLLLEQVEPEAVRV